MSENTIYFFTEDISYKIRGRENLRRGIEQLVRKSKYQLGSLNIIFCSDRFVRKLNKKYLDQDNCTDVIAFDFSEEKFVISGDIYVSIERVRENAKEYKEKLQTEIGRIIIHGILHLMGMEDTTKRLKKEMKEEEDKHLSYFVRR
ncbi:MAG: rRNA maturation RNase YbeY [Bacteroidota bacterium]